MLASPIDTVTRKPTSRQLLIALNCGSRLARDSVCRLARNLDQWPETDEPEDLIGRRLGVPPSSLHKARQILANAESLAARQIERAADLETRILTLEDSDYPQSLRDLELPPPVLYCRGELPERPGIAIVGSRKATPEGLETAELFGRELAARGLRIVSGFAQGIDHAAHRGALSSERGETVAVLGCGLDIDYPRRRASIRQQIASRGALISEFPFGTRPAKVNFPIRNRIIAALSSGTLVVQGARRSGSLITARLALDLGRDVYAIPGSIFDPRAEGTNALIRDGAMLVSHPEEILESLPLAARALLDEQTRSPARPVIDGVPNQLFDLLLPGRPISADQLAETAGIPLEQVLGILMRLEISGLVKRFPGAVFCRRP